MCGRFTLTARADALHDLFPLLDLLNEPARYNVAPSQSVPAVRWSEGRQQIEWAHFRWGLVPSWADDIKIGYRLINARAETVADKPAFRAGFKRRRCLLPADGFYEWRKQGKQRQPFHIRRR